MTLQNALDYVNSLRANPDSPSGDDEELMIDLVYLSSIDTLSMLRFPFDLERKTITAAGTSTESMDADFDNILGTVYVSGMEYTLLGIEDLNEISVGSRYTYLTYDKSTGLWTLNINPTPEAGTEITFTQKTRNSKVEDTESTLPYPDDICMYIIYDVAARLEWQDDESTKGEELKQRKEMLLRDLKKKYNYLGNKNNRYLQFAGGRGFGDIGNHFTTTV